MEDHRERRTHADTTLYQMTDNKHHASLYFILHVTADETFENVVITLFYFEQGTDENYYDFFCYISYFHSAWIPYTLRRGTASSTTRRPAAAGSSCRSPPRRSVSGASGAPSTGARRDRRARSSFLSSPRRRHDKRTFRIEYNLILMYSTREF